MSKRKKKSGQSPQKREWNPKLLVGGAVAAVVLLVCLIALFFGKTSNVSAFEKKLALLETEALTDWMDVELGIDPAGTAGYAVFFSACDGTRRADVYHGTGDTIKAAWNEAAKQTERAVSKQDMALRWLKVDLVYLSERVSAAELSKALKSSRQEFFRYGLAFDYDYQTALLEAELNGAKIYDYENNGIDLDYLNRYLEKAGRDTLAQLPDTYTLFQCFGWLCDEDDIVYALNSSGLDYGRRAETVDAERAKELILNASDFLERQVNEDGSFVYGIYPRFDNDIENYNIVRHASTVWSLLCRYRLAPDAGLAEKIDKTFDYLLTQLVYDSRGRAYLYEEKADEIKLGGCGMAVVAMTEYMDVFENKKFQEECEALGEGILYMMDRESGKFYHVLNGDFSPKEEMRTVYYDGEATFALSRLYSLTGDQKWLDAAQRAVEHFIDADYTQYKDHWVAYSMNEITKHIPDNLRYYIFAMENAQVNLETIRDRDTTYHTYLELLMATFEVYDRMTENGISMPSFNMDAFLDTIATRVNRQLNGYFYPEYAMYMANPQRILNTFMVRHDGYRVRIDDVQHNIGGYYLYYKNYDKLVEYGLLDKGE